METINTILEKFEDNGALEAEETIKEADAVLKLGESVNNLKNLTVVLNKGGINPPFKTKS